MSATLPTSMTTSNPQVTTVSSIKTDQTISTDSTLLKEQQLDSTHKEPRDALDQITGPSVGDQIKVAASKTATSLSAAATSAGHSISAAASSAGHTISEKTHDLDSRFHLSDKMNDAASFVGTALKQGNPIHAMKHVGHASAIGSAERAKHENGPLPEGAHSVSHQLADSTQNVGASTVSGGYGTVPAQPSNMDIAKDKAASAAASVSAAASNVGAKIQDSASSAAASASQMANTASIKASETASSMSQSASQMGSQMQHSMAASSTNMGNQASDAAAFAGTAIKQGNPVFAASNASTAAKIGQAEREKHAIGNLPSTNQVNNQHQI